MARFTLTSEHLALLKRANIEWVQEAYEGAPGLDNKRPFGNSDVLQDVAEIVYGDRFESMHEDGDFFYVTETPSEQPDPAVVHERVLKVPVSELNRLFKETETALQIVLSTQSFTLGEYVTTRPYDRSSWALVGEGAKEASW